MGLEPYQERMIEERRELETRVTKLGMLVELPAFSAFDAEEQQLLTLQLHAMRSYLRALDMRIARFRAAS